MRKLNFILILLLVVCSEFTIAQSSQSDLRNRWSQPQESARPWTFWYWMHGAVTKEAISADLKAMKDVGIAGAYLMPIKSPLQPPHINSPVVQLSPEWWEMIRFTFSEAKNQGIQLGFHVSDGFALAGGPWITPEFSMQKLVWSTSVIKAGETNQIKLSQPESLEGFYKDIAVYAFPSLDGSGISTQTIKPKITGSKPDSILQKLTDLSNNKNFSSEEHCWIQYEFEQPFTCRSILIRSRNNYQSNRLTIQASDDGKNFRTIKQLVPPRHGWQDWDANYTHSIPVTIAKYFRFLYNREGSEPGAEDLDAAKWKQSLKVYGIELSSEARVDQYEGKNGEVWRISETSSNQLIAGKEAIRSKDLINISQYLSKDGTLNWKAPSGEWTILRIGHTSTGHRNETAGGGKGLECDKFNPAAVTLQFNKWFGEIYNQVDADLVKTVLKYLHIDSWECGSQNWSADFAKEFEKRRGYDLLSYLPVVAGYPIDDVSFSEKLLRDLRETISELVNDKFYITLADLAKTKGVQMSAESVAPTMVSDGMLHYKTADFPMGEFWLRSPTHDKPNDMLDAISGAHIYGKQIVQAESFTELRMAWDEHPGMLKTLLDQNFAKGLNRMFYHVYVHNPWLDKKPGMTLDAIGLFYQRDQTWWKHSKGFNEYIQRCQSLLQFGSPVTDIAVFTGENVPRRSILPDRLISILPGIFKKEKLVMEKKRLKNDGLPLRVLPAGVTHSANMADPEDWIDPLNGYAYDSYNKDALLNLTSVEDGNIQLSTGAHYRLLVIPGAHKLSPNKGLISQESAMKIRKLVKDGATVIIGPDQEIIKKILGNEKTNSYKAGYAVMGKGKVIFGPYHSSSFDSYGIEKDFIAFENNRSADDIAWTHRRGEGTDVYFISNQKDIARTVRISLRIDGKLPEIWNPADGSIMDAKEFKMLKGRTELTLNLERNASLFIVMQKSISRTASSAKGKNWLTFTRLQTLNEPWFVRFDTAYRGPAETIQWKTLKDWSQSEDSSIRYYSGTAVYQTSFEMKPSTTNQRVWLNMNQVANSAEVFINGKSCGISWVAPYRVEITKAIKKGKNELKIEVINTWANRMIGDQRLPKEQRATYTPHNFNFQGRQLLPAGLIGPVMIETGK